MAILQVDPTTNPLWTQLINTTESSVFHTPGWIKAVAETYGFSPRALVQVGDLGEPNAGVSYCLISDLISQRYVIFPFSDYCDPIVNNLDEWKELTGEMQGHIPIMVRCLHCDTPLADKRFKKVKQARWHGMDIRPDLSTLWDGLEQTCKRAIRRAERSEMKIRPAQDKSELERFFELHLRLRKQKYHLLAQPYSFFENIWECCIEKGNGQLLLALLDDEIIGGTLFLVWKDTLYYKFNASSSEHLSYRPNDLLMWEGIRYGKSHKLTALDLGLCDWDQEGLRRYKCKYATEEKTIYFLRQTSSDGPTQQEKEARTLLPLLTDLLTHESVPETITDRASEVLYRYFT